MNSLDNFKLARLKKDLYASKRNLRALDCEYVTLEPTEKNQVASNQEKLKSRNTIEVILKYGFEDTFAMKEPSILKGEFIGDEKKGDMRKALDQMAQGELRARQMQITDRLKRQEETYKTFKYQESKESQNILKIVKKDGLPQVTIGHKASEVQIDNSSIIITQRSQSVEPSQMNKIGVSRFYNFENERQKSKISQLLSNPIEIPSYLDSSFIRDEKRVKKLIKGNSSNSSVIKGGSSGVTILPSIIQDKKLSRNTMISSDNPYSVQLPSSNQLVLPLKALMKNDSMIQYLDTSNRTFETVIQTSVERPLEQPDKYQGFKMIKTPSDAKPRLSKSVVRLRKLASQVKIEKDTFKRQKMLFRLVEEFGDQPIGLQEMQIKEEPPRKTSPLKSEKPTSSIIQLIQPTFPLKSDIITKDQSKNPTLLTQDTIAKVQAIQGGEPDKMTFSTLTSVAKTFEIQTAKYNTKMIQMNDILQQRIYDVQKEQLDDAYILQNFQRQLNQKSKMIGTKVHSNKEFNDFDILVWPKMKSLEDHRGIKISKTGYEIDDETAIGLEKEEESKVEQEMQTKISQLGGYFSNRSKVDNFQAYSKVTSNKRKERHDRCLPGHQQVFNNSPKYQESPKQDNNPETKDLVPELSKQKTQAFLQEDNSKRLSFKSIREEQTGLQRSDTVLSQNMNDDLFQLMGRQRAISKIDSPSNATPSHAKSPQQERISFHEKSSPGQPYQRMSSNLKKQVTIKKKSKKQLQKEKEQQELREKEQERLEMLEYERQEKQLKLLKKVGAFVGEKQDELLEVSQEIIEMENYSDDEFDIYQNNQMAIAYSTAKRKVIQREHRELLHRQQIKYGSPARLHETLPSSIRIVSPKSPQMPFTQLKIPEQQNAGLKQPSPNSLL